MTSLRTKTGLMRRAKIGCASLLLLCGSHSFADYEDGVNAVFSGDYDTAFREFSLAAESGLHLAQYNLGILYFFGQGVDKDLEQSFRWTQAAAEQGHVAAQHNLGSLYYEGQGVDRDRATAVEWYSTAAKAGHADAALLLAEMFQQGVSVRRDPVQAHAWASMAVNNEHVEASSLRESIENRMNQEQLNQARRLFAQWQIE